MQERQQPGHWSKFDNVPSRKEVSDAWNFDFDENESDGAEVLLLSTQIPGNLIKIFPQTDKEMMKI